MNYMIYLPDDVSSKFVTVYNKDTIRVYDTQPEFNSTSTYTDYFINSHYLKKSGSESFTNIIPVTVDNSYITTDFYYRNDFPQIMFIFQ